MIVQGIDLQVGFSSVRLAAAGKVIHVDPAHINRPERADAILITHEHDRHLSLPDIAKVFHEDAVVVINPVCHPPLLQLDRDIHTLVVVAAGERYEADGFSILTTPAYTTSKTQGGRPCHPQLNDGLGFLITLAGKTIYVAGDTDIIPEMASFPPVDIALLPVSGGTVMTAEEAAQAAAAIKPTTAIPMHGSPEDQRAFEKLAACEVVLSAD
ncbi:MAG: MBL fold metallo-hydrolase [Candidatus Aenigmarchaeota archaeon]|nr:MBL fold metallo-hydrolase [Candidatus Aenigmarchaeota archaeon]